MALVIPTYFTAVDKFSSPVLRMQANMDVFAARAEVAVARSERAFRKLTPAIGETAKNMMSMAGTFALVAAGALSVKAITDYETAVQSFRTIVDDLNDVQFDAYKRQIGSVARDTQRSTVDVALSFEKIAALNYKFAETAEGLGAVSTAALILARASGMELGPASENLVGIMNQFSYGALDANKAINILAAGQAVGAASITQTAEAFVNFGSTASGANITLEESVALIQTLGKFSLLGADAGTALRGSIIKLQKAGLGYTSGQFKMNDALEEARSKIDRLHTAKEKDALITKIFGIHNITAGRILLSNIETYKEFVGQVTNTNEAQKQADINSQTLMVTLDNLKNSWVTMITTSDKVSSGLYGFTKVTQFLTRNLDTIVSVAVNVLVFFSAWWAVMKLVNFWILTTTVSSNILYVVQMIKYISMTQGMTFATAAWQIATATLNATMLANPIGIVIIAIAALSAGIYAVIQRKQELDAAFKSGVEKSKSEIINKQKLAIDSLTTAFVRQGYAQDVARDKAVAHETALNNVRIANLKFLESQQKNKLANINPVWDFLNGSNESKNAKKALAETQIVLGIANANKSENKLINPKESQAQYLSNTINKNTNKNVTVDFKNVPPGVDISGDGIGENITPVSTSTMPHKR